MIIYKEVRVKKEAPYIITDGLSDKIGWEFRILQKAKTDEGYFRVLNYLIDYFLVESNIANEQTITFHSWLLQLRKVTGRYYDLWEVKSDGDGFIEGVDYSLQVVNQQEEECRKQGVKPIFPTFGQKVVISKGVYDGYDVDSVRYPSPDHMTGWWVTTELYDDDIETLMIVHYFDIAFKRPDILKYFALPFGYRFYMTKEEKNIWFDESVLIDD